MIRRGAGWLRLRKSEPISGARRLPQCQRQISLVWHAGFRRQMVEAMGEPAGLFHDAHDTRQHFTHAMPQLRAKRPAFAVTAGAGRCKRDIAHLSAFWPHV